MKYFKEIEGPKSLILMVTFGSGYHTYNGERIYLRKSTRNESKEMRFFAKDFLKGTRGAEELIREYISQNLEIKIVNGKEAVPGHEQKLFLELEISQDYSIEKSSFLNALSWMTLNLWPYSSKMDVETYVNFKDFHGKIIQSYIYKDRLTYWRQLFLFPLFPFYEGYSQYIEAHLTRIRRIFQDASNAGLFKVSS